MEPLRRSTPSEINIGDRGDRTRKCHYLSVGVPALLLALAGSAVSVAQDRLPGDSSAIPGALNAIDFGDVTGDGILDTVAATDQGLFLLRGSALKGFGEAIDLTATIPALGAHPIILAVVLRDLDDDDDRDAMITFDFGGIGATPKATATLQNDGSGAFVLSSFDTVSSVLLDAADLDSDGLLDLIVRASNGSAGSVRRGIGVGQYAAPQALPSSFNMKSAALADFDLDGDIDFVGNSQTGLGGANYHSEMIYQQTSPFVFSATPLLSAVYANDPHVGDIDQDGRADVVFGATIDTPTDLDMSVYVSSALGTPHPMLKCDAYGRIGIGDIEGNGSLDVVSMSHGTLMIAHNSGAGLFAPTIHSPTPFGSDVFVSPRLLDVNGDGAAELIQPTAVGFTTFRSVSGALELPVVTPPPIQAANFLIAATDLDAPTGVDLLAFKSGTPSTLDVVRWSDADSVTTLASTPFQPPTMDRIVTGDLDQDGRQDAAYLASDSSAVLIYLKYVRWLPSGLSSLDTLWIGSGGFFSVQYKRLTIGNLDGDAVSDAVVVDTQNSTAIAVLDVASPAPQVLTVATPLPAGLDRALVDVSNDGRDDLLVVDGKTLRIFYSDGLGGFTVGGIITLPWSSSANPSSGSLVTADFDSDGHRDAVVTIGTLGATTNSLLRGLPSGGLGAATPILPGELDVTAASGEMVVLDLDHDQDLDVVIGDTWLRNDAGVLLFHDRIVGTSSNHLVADFDDDGFTDLIGAGTLWLDKDQSVFVAGLQGCPGAVGRYGYSCPGSGAIAPELRLTGCPQSGGRIRLQLEKAVGNTIGLMLVGAPTSIPLPNGCSLWIALPIPVAAPIGIGGSGPGNGGVDLVVDLGAVPPATAALQFLIADPGAVGGMTSTNAFAITVD